MLRHGAVLKKAAVDAAFSEVEKCIPNPCENNATCLNDRIRCRCICPASADTDNAIVGVKCNESKILYIAFSRLVMLNGDYYHRCHHTCRVLM